MDIFGITPHEILIIVFVGGGSVLTIKWLKNNMLKVLDFITDFKIKIVEISSILNNLSKASDKLERENERTSERLQRLEMDVAYIKHIFEEKQKS